MTQSPSSTTRAKKKTNVSFRFRISFLLPILYVSSCLSQQMTFVFAAKIWNFRHFHYYEYFFRIVSASCLLLKFCWVRVVVFWNENIEKKRISQPLVGISFWSSWRRHRFRGIRLPPQQKKILIYLIAWAARYGRINAALVVWPNAQVLCLTKILNDGNSVCDTLCVGCWLSTVAECVGPDIWWWW